MCYADHGVSNTRVHLEMLESISKVQRTKADKAVFEVTFNNTTSAGRIVFKKATEIWSEIITSDIPIRISVNWIALDENVLGSARPSSREANFPGAPQKNVLYPITLAERIAGTELNDSTDFEINISFNTEFEWSYSLDGEVDSLKHDFLSVALHEIGHGLGLSDSFTVSGSSGSWGINGFPTIYDTYILNVRNDQLIDRDQFENGSQALKTQLISGRLKFGSELAKPVNGAEYPRIYSPSEFDGGSSISHLDEQVFPPGDENSLMTPQLSRGEVVLGPGDIISQMLADMGYVWAFFDHTPLEEFQEAGKDIELLVSIRGDSTLLDDDLWVYFSDDDFTNESQLPLSKTENPNEYTVTIPSPLSSEKIRYYFSASDVTQRKYTWPAIPADSTFSIAFDITTGIGNDFESQNQLSIYPNPTKGNIHVEMEFSKPVSSVELMVFNVHGNLVRHERSRTSSSRFIKDLTLYDRPGIYFLQIRTEDSVTRRKFILE
jgi:hypothetical protein